MRHSDKGLRLAGALFSVLLAAGGVSAAEDASAFAVDWWAVIKTSPTLWVLVVISFVMFAFFIERLITFRAFRGDPENMMREISGSLESADVPSAVQATKKQDIPLARVLRHALEAWPVSKGSLQEKLDIARIKEKVYMDKRMSFFATMSTTGPFIGLFGTVIGIVMAFNTLAVTGAGGKEQLMKGISEALVATAAGILVGVLSAVFFNFFTVRQKTLLAEVDVYGKELVILLVEKVAGKSKR